MLKDDDWKLAIDDARKRHEATMSLVLFIDTQAMNLLRLYLTIGAAAASAAVAGLSNSAPIPFVTSWALVGVAAAMLLGSWFCFRAMETAEISLPGRGSEFWVWASREDVKREAVFDNYLQNLVAETQFNRDLNATNANAFRRAKLCGVFSPLAAFIVGGTALLIVTFCYN